MTYIHDVYEYKGFNVFANGNCKIIISIFKDKRAIGGKELGNQLAINELRYRIKAIKLELSIIQREFIVIGL